MVRTFCFEPLTPVSFLRRSAAVFGDRPAVVDGDLSVTYAELWARCTRLAGSLAALGVDPGDRVAVLAPNTHVLLESHYGVPLAGACLVALNHRLSPRELGYILGHAGVRVLVVDHELSALGKEAASEAEGPAGLHVVTAGTETSEYERRLADAEPLAVDVDDETSVISLNYTSGTTGKPKGVMYHHRGAYLQALAMVAHLGLGPSSGFLWTLPMFHCNGWCFTWAVTAAGATHICLRRVDPGEVWRHLRSGRVSHFNGAPTVLTSVAYHRDADAGPTPRPVQTATGGAPPSPTLLARMAALDIGVTHLYGLTETYGPAVICEWRPEWDDLDPPAQARIKARQGVGNVVSREVRVVDPQGGDVPADGATMGEIALRGNNLMLGYYRDAEATAQAVPDGWFRTGDLGVLHPDGYVELRDRAKDVVISGGENIASVEVEQTLASHPAVLEVAVIGEPDPHWGEVPVAYVTLQDGATATPGELIDHVRARLAHYKAPRSVVFGPLPKTSTGKIQKYVLRERAWQGSGRRIG